MAQGELIQICVSAKKGIAKNEVPSAEVVAGWGIAGDAHAGDWHRQVSVLGLRDIDGMRAKGLTLPPGAFGENLIFDGLDIDQLGIGSQLRVGPVLLELTQIGKVCHKRCAIFYSAGDCIMPRLGVFALVLEGGTLIPGMPVEVIKAVSRAAIQAAVVTISDRCSAGTMQDTAGPAVADLLRTELAANVACQTIVPDEMDAIARAIKDACGRRVDLVLTAGGTGITKRDVTPEATLPLLDREVPGLAEAMRSASAKITPNAWVSRALVGIRGETLIVNLPGSRKAATENLSAILPSLAHAVKMLRNEAAHPESDAGRAKADDHRAVASAGVGS